MNAFKEQIVIIIVLVLSIASQTPIYANDTYYYRDCHVKLRSPSSAKGVVYVEMTDYEKRNAKNPTLQSKPGKTAELKANLRAEFFYSCRLLAYPQKGWVLDGFVSKEDYLSNNTTKAFFLKDGSLMNRPCKSGSLCDIAKCDTLTDTKSDPFEPHRLVSYKFTAKSFKEIYAVFRKAVSVSVFVNASGTLKEEVLKIENGELADDIIIVGELDDSDFKFLKEMCSNNLVRIDLSKAIFKEIPPYAFDQIPSLYEFIPPKYGLKRIGEKAFRDCRSLKPFAISNNVEIGESAFEGCVTWNIAF